MCLCVVGMDPQQPAIISFLFAELDPDIKKSHKYEDDCDGFSLISNKFHDACDDVIHGKILGENCYSCKLQTQIPRRISCDKIAAIAVWTALFKCTKDALGEHVCLCDFIYFGENTICHVVVLLVFTK